MDKTFEAMCKLEDVELELHRLKNALEMMTRAYDAKKEWVELTEDEIEELTSVMFEEPSNEEVIDFALRVQAALKAKNA